ncbi:hypothetical protein GEMRC1_006530 [Eukaryota sp. GEM-RC1]
MLTTRLASFFLCLIILLPSVFCTLTWSDFQWSPTSSQSMILPGPNLYSSNKTFSDELGFLHLKVHQKTVYGFGTYSFELETGFQTMDENLVLSLGLSTDNDESFGLEFSHNTSDSNSRYLSKAFVHSFSWYPDRIEFSSAVGTLSDNEVFYTWEYNDVQFNNPYADLVLTFWLKDGMEPADGQGKEVIIRFFTFSSHSIIHWEYVIVFGLIAVFGTGFIVYDFQKKRYAHQRLRDSSSFQMNTL